MMKTTNNEFETQVAELERMLRSETAAARRTTQPARRAAQPTHENARALARAHTLEESREPKTASIVCGLLAGTLILCTVVNQKPSRQDNIYPTMPLSADAHTIEGTAAIHRSMQTGTVNVSKSTITGIVDSRSMTASLYWTFVLKNHNSTDKEAAITMELPKNSALSRVTLWIKGVPQEAAFSSNSQVKNAYDSIVVRHRDPLLVTQIAPNKIKILAAPVTANGGEMKFRIGITAPAERAADGRNFVSMPSILESNIKFDSRQDIHLSSDTTISGAGTTEKSGSYTLKANIPADQLNNVKITMENSTENTFATRLTHTNPSEYLQAVVADGELQLKRVHKKPSGKIINDDSVAFRLSNIWAHQEIERLAATGDVNAASNLANVYRIVSSVSGATVLEEEYDYKSNGLNRDIYRTLGRSASTGDNFTQIRGFIPYSANEAMASAPQGDVAMLQGAAPFLQGATNGTIGPQGADAIVIMGVNSDGSVRVNTLANVEALLTILSNVLQVTGYAQAAYILSEAALNNGLQAPVRLSRLKTFWLALIVGIAAGLTPCGLNMLVAWMRDGSFFLQ
jgi:hypothetical protein